MAQHASAEKRNRQNQKRKTRNSALRNRTRTAIKSARTAVETKSPKKGESVKEAVSALNRAATKRVISKSTASRQISRLMKAAAKA